MKEVQGKPKQTVIPKLISNDNTATTDLEKAEVLNGFFSSQTILPNCGTSFPDKLSLPQNTRSFNTLHTTPKEVFDILSHLKKGKAPGIEDITQKRPASALRKGNCRKSLCSFQQKFRFFNISDSMENGTQCSNIQEGR